MSGAGHAMADRMQGSPAELEALCHLQRPIPGDLLLPDRLRLLRVHQPSRIAPLAQRQASKT